MSAPLLLALALVLPPVLPDDADDQYNFIVGLAEKGLNEMVVRESQTFLSEHGSHAKAPLARYRLATALFDLGKSDDARPHFEKLYRIQRFEFAEEVWFRYGQCELERGAHEPAAALFERVRKGGEDYLKTPATFLLGEARFRAGEFAKAQRQYATVFTADDAGDYQKDAAHGLAWCAYRLEEYDDAVDLVDDYLRRWKNDERAGELTFLKAESLFESGEHEVAFDTHRRVQAGPFHDAAVRGAAFALAGQSKHTQAAEWFGRLLADFPKSRYREEAALHCGIHRLKGGDPAGAIEVLRSRDVPKSARPLYWLGRAFAKAEREGEALAAYDQALRVKPDDELSARIHVARGDVLFDMGKSEEAAAAYENAGSDYAIHAAAVARLNDGEPAEAVRLARPLAERQGPYRVEAQLTLGEGLFAQERYEPAEAAFTIVAREDEDPQRKARAASRVAWCRYLAGDFPAAAERFAAVSRQHAKTPEAAEAIFMEARARESAGDSSGARKAYDRYLTAHPQGEHRIESLLRVSRFEDGAGGEARLAKLLSEAASSEFAGAAHYELAERLSKTKRFEDALPHYEAVVKNHRGHELASSASYGAAWCQYSLGQWQAAMKSLRPLVNAGAGGETESSLRIAALELSVWSARKAGDARTAHDSFLAFASHCDDEARRLRAAKVCVAALKDAGDLGGAQKLYDDLLKSTRGKEVAVELCVERAYLSLDAKKTEEAEKLARAAHKYAADDVGLLEVFFFVGEARFAEGEDAKAAELYDLAASSSDAKTAQRALYKGGFARLRSEDESGAARCFERLVTQHPGCELYGEGLFLLGESHYRAGNYDDAIRWLSKQRAEVPRHETAPKALFRLGVAQARREKWKDAQTTLAELASRHADFENLTESELWRGRSLAALKKPRAARQAFDRVIEKDRGVLSAQARIELGKLALAEGNDDDALSQFLKVAVLYAHEEEVAEALYRAGRVLEGQGEPEQAKKQYTELIEKHPKAAFAQPARERLNALGN